MNSTHLHKDYKQIEAALTAAVTNFESMGTYVTKGERNVIKKFEIEGVYYNIKKFKTPNPFQSLVYQYLRKSKAKRSFLYAEILTARGIKTPLPVGYVENFSAGLKESYYISQHVDYDFDFRVLNHNPLWPNRAEILRQMAAFTFQLHEKEINFLDHSPGNTLINHLGEDRYEFYLIDLNRMRFETMDFEKRMRNFRRLWLSKTMINIMAKEYAKLYNKSEAQTHALMTSYSRAFQKKKNRKKLRKRK
ncbi:MAG: lipopolysaccharide kinase [Flavobacteriaceae bacterium]|nr:lipopolysaccharide kinase [Flavobacteriaceae bacterium]|tara:strand:+ start:232 stop:975 length:744 start_codon:yes stop_codon:yes gene_type:complete